MQVHWPKPCKARSAPDFNTWPTGGCSSILHSGAPLCSKCLSPHFKREIMGNQSSYEPWCSQVSYLHCSLGYMHRDLKPENVMMTKTDHLKLIDFGSAAAIDGSDGVSEVIPLCYILVSSVLKSDVCVLCPSRNRRLLAQPSTSLQRSWRLSDVFLVALIDISDARIGGRAWLHHPRTYGLWLS